MYEPYETDISKKYLTTVIKQLEEPVCLLGGWAVHKLVNKNFKKETGRDYIGSRDIDIGFHIDLDWTESELKNSQLARSMKTLEKQGFKPIGFRYIKEFHSETKNELKPPELETTPAHFVFPLYIDPIVDMIHPKFYKVFNFHPIDEPLLKPVFKNDTNRTTIPIDNKKLWIPKPHILLATKLNSLIGRDKEHKKIKDITDIYALIWYTDIEIQKIKTGLEKVLDTKFIRHAINNIQDKEIEAVEDIIGISQKEIKRILLELKR